MQKWLPLLMVGMSSTLFAAAEKRLPAPFWIYMATQFEVKNDWGLKDFVHEWGIHVRDADGKTPLHALWRFPLLIDEGIQLGFDVNAKSDSGQSVLMACISEGCRSGLNQYVNVRLLDAITSAKYLIHAGADYKEVDVHGNTILHYLASARLSDSVYGGAVLSHLLPAFPDTFDLTIKNNDGKSVLDMCSGYVEVERYHQDYKNHISE